MAVLCTLSEWMKRNSVWRKKGFYSPILLKHSLKKRPRVQNESHEPRAALTERIVRVFSWIVFQRYLVFLGIDLGSNTIQIPASLRGKSASTIGILFDEFQLFQSLQALPGNGSRASGPMAGSTTIISSDWKINLKMSVGWNTVNAIRKYVNRLESTFNIPNLFPLCTIEIKFKMG